MLPERVNGLLDKVLTGGPWALLVVIVAFWLLQDAGILSSQSKDAAQTIRQHADESKHQTKALEKIVEVLQEQKAIQAETARILCLQNAKTDTERQVCARIR